MTEELMKRVAIATICDYICPDRNYTKYEKCREMHRPHTRHDRGDKVINSEQAVTQ